MKRIEHSRNDEDLVTQAFKPGATYVLADLGDDVTDLTVYRVRGDDRFEKLCHAAGCAWGSSYVKKNFVDLLETIFGKDTIEKYKADYPGDWDDLFFWKFEIVIRHAACLGHTNYLEFPWSFIGDSFSWVKDAIAAQGNANLKFTRGALAMKYPEVKKLFEPVFDNIAQHLAMIIRKVGRVKYMILVGGFASCRLLQEYLHDRFEKPFNLRIIIPSNSSLAVVMGAVLFGHDQTKIKTCRLRHSYGIECLGMSELPDLPNPSDRSSDFTFRTFMRRNQEMAVGEEVTLPFYPVHDDQTSAKIVVYKSDKERTMHVSEEGVRKVGVIELPLPNTSLGRNRMIVVSMKFEKIGLLKVYSLDLSSGERVEGFFKSAYTIHFIDGF